MQTLHRNLPSNLCVNLHLNHRVNRQIDPLDLQLPQNLQDQERLGVLLRDPLALVLLANLRVTPAVGPLCNLFLSRHVRLLDNPLFSHQDSQALSLLCNLLDSQRGNLLANLRLSHRNSQLWSRQYNLLYNHRLSLPLNRVRFRVRNLRCNRRGYRLVNRRGNHLLSLQLSLLGNLLLSLLDNRL